VFDEAMYASKVKVPALAESYPLRVVDEPVLSTQGDRANPPARSSSSNTSAGGACRHSSFHSV
jgi:hypothetical protein